MVFLGPSWDHTSCATPHRALVGPRGARRQSRLIAIAAYCFMCGESMYRGWRDMGGEGVAFAVLANLIVTALLVPAVVWFVRWGRRTDDGPGDREGHGTWPGADRHQAVHGQPTAVSGRRWRRRARRGRRRG